MSNGDFTLAVEKRTEFGKGPAHRLRAQGKVPGVVYGHGKDAVPLSIDGNALLPFLHHTGLLKINIAGRKRALTAVLKDVQYDVITGHVEHVDFQEVRADEIVTATIPIEYHGEPAGAQTGGVLNQSVFELEIRCPANKLPESIEVDVSHMELDDVMHVRELPLPDEAQPEVDPEQVVFSVTMPTFEPEPEEEAEEAELEGIEGEEMEEPEVIGKGKKEEEEPAPEESEK